jgi:hypothetical protein
MSAARSAGKNLSGRPLRTAAILVVVLALIQLGGAIRSKPAYASAAVEGAISWAQNLVGSGDNYTGLCLVFVRDAYLKGAGVDIGSADTALDYWNERSSAQHRGDTNPPRGALVFWGATGAPYPNSAGHVGISLGGGQVISSYSYPTTTSDPDAVHMFSIAARDSSGFYPYLGWMDPPGVDTATSAATPPAITDGTRFTEGSSLQQYISVAGAALPLSYGDAQAYDGEGNTNVVADQSNYAATNPASGFPSNTVVRVVGVPTQYFYDGSQMLPIDAPATSSCLLFIHNQGAPEVVPTMWFDTYPVGSGVPCSLPDGTRFTETGSLQQYVSIRGASLPVSYADAVALNTEQNPAVATMPVGYVSGHPATALPADTIVRVVGTPSQYLYDGAALDPIGSPDVSACLLQQYTETSPEVVPSMWADTIPAGPGVQCPAGTGGDGGPPASQIPVARVAGPNREATAVAASQLEYATVGAAKAVVLSRDDNFADALAGGPLAAKLGGPLLLTNSGALSTATAAEIRRVLPLQSTVYLLGGPAAISATLDDSLHSMGYVTTRLAGADRYATATIIAHALGDPKIVFEATGLNYPDALAAVPAAVQASGAILLTDGSSQSPETAAYLSQYSPKRYALGGPASKADPTATSLAGPDRYATAVAVDQRFFPQPTSVGAVSGGAFPDALSAGPLLGLAGAPLVLVPGDGSPPSSVTTYLNSIASSATSGTAFGGTQVLGDDALQWVAGLG